MRAHEARHRGGATAPLLDLEPRDGCDLRTRPVRTSLRSCPWRLIIGKHRATVGDLPPQSLNLHSRGTGKIRSDGPRRVLDQTRQLTCHVQSGKFRLSTLASTTRPHASPPSSRWSPSACTWDGHGSSLGFQSEVTSSDASGVLNNAAPWSSHPCRHRKPERVFCRKTWRPTC
jgi:hypothetical protein